MQSDIFFGLEDGDQTEGMIQVVRNWMQVGNSGVVLGYLEDTFFLGASSVKKGGCSSLEDTQIFWVQG